MKIIHMVCDNLPPGGFQYAVHNLCNELCRRAHDVILLCRKKDWRLPPSIFELEEEEILYRVERYFLPPLRGYFHQFLGQIAIRTLLKRFPADIIHCTMGWPCPTWCLDGFAEPFPGLVAMFQGADVQINPEYGYGMRLNPRIDAEIKRVISECPNLLTISQAMCEELISLGAGEKKVAVLHNGVNVSLYQGETPANPFSHRYIFAMGRLINKKGYDLLLQSFARVEKKLSDKIHLCIAGDGPERENLKRLAVELGILDRVHFIGFVSGALKVSWLMNAMFFVHPARREAFGIVNAEALAAGLPIIAFAVDGHLDIVQDGYNGFLVEPYNVESFNNKIQILIENQVLLKKMSANALQSSSRFDWPFLAGELEKYYETIISSRT